MSKKNISTMAILLIPIGIAINVVGGQIALVLKLPIFIDVIGTILVGALCGPLFGGITGLATNLILGITAPTWIPYAIVNIAIGVVAGLCAKKGWFSTIKGAIITSVLIWLITQITANPVTVLVYGGITGSGSSFITSFLLATGQGLWASVISTALITETVDKFVSVFIVFAILKSIPKRTIAKFPLGEDYLKA